MKTGLFLFCILLANDKLYAQAPSQGGVIYHVYDVPEKDEYKNIVCKKGDQNCSVEFDTRASQQETSLPPIDVRDQILKQADLNSEISEMDDLSRDLLFEKAQHWPLASLIKAYPYISQEKLIKLKQLAQAQQKQQ